MAEMTTRERAVQDFMLYTTFDSRFLAYSDEACRAAIDSVTERDFRRNGGHLYAPFWGARLDQVASDDLSKDGGE